MIHPENTGQFLSDSGMYFACENDMVYFGLKAAEAIANISDPLPIL